MSLFNNRILNALQMIATGEMAEIVKDSFIYRVMELERHFHGWDRRVGVAVTPSGETHVADLLGPSVTYFSMTGGNNTWGSWVQVLGSSDTPQQSGYKYYDFHNIQFVGTDYNGSHFIQIAFGESADLATKISDKTYTALVYDSTSNQVESVSHPTMTRRQAAGTKAWVRCMAGGQNGKYLRFFCGFHEYEG